MSLFKFLNYFYLMCMNILPACVYICVSHVCSDHKGQKRASDFLGLKLKMAVNCHIGAGNQRLVLWKSSQGS